ncbi:MAG: N-acetyltransferase [Bacteroidales bacterium]|nr:N-acetyltransferase [Bacteroidales bacterium]
MIQIKEVKTGKDIKQFVELPFKLYKGHPYWVPPVKKEEINQLKAEANPAFAFCDARFWTAWENGSCVGRIAAIINQDYNKKTGRKMGRFSRFEVIDKQEVTDKLFETAQNWLSEKGMEAIHGPLGFTNLDNQGLLIEGFDYLPSIASVMHFPYYRKHIEKLGFEKENDWVEFRLKIEAVPEKALRLVEIIKKRNNLEVIHFREKAEMKNYLKEVFHLLNKAFDELPYVAPFSDDMIEYSAKKYMDVLKPKYIVVIKKDGVMVAFIVGLPSLSKAMQKAGGKLFPFGFLHVIKALNNPEVMDLLLTGVDPHLQKMGLPAILISELQKSMIENGVKYVETTGMFEDNLKGATTWKNYDHIQHKRRRCFVKDL